jgi:hypothetical protein
MNLTKFKSGKVSFAIKITVFLARQNILQQLTAVYGPNLKDKSLMVLPLIAGNSSSLIGSAVGLSLYHAKWISLSPFLEIRMFFDLMKSRCGVLPPTQPCNFSESNAFEMSNGALKLHKTVWRYLVHKFTQTGGVILCISWIWAAVYEAFETKQAVQDLIEFVEEKFTSIAKDSIMNRFSKVTKTIPFDQLSILYLTSFPVEPTDFVSGPSKSVEDLEADGLIWTVTSEDNFYKNIIIPEVLLSFHLSKKCQALDAMLDSFALTISSSLTLPMDKSVVRETLLKVFRWSNALREPASLLNFSAQLGLRFEKEIAYILLFRILTPIGKNVHNAKTLGSIFPESRNMASLATLIIPPNLYFAKSQYVGKSPDEEWLKNGGIVVNCPGAKYGDVVLFGFEKDKPVAVEIALDAKCIRQHSPQTIFEEYQRCIVPKGNAQAVISIRPFLSQEKQKLGAQIPPYWKDYQQKYQQENPELKHWPARGFVCTGRSLLGEMAFNWLQNDLENSKNLALTLDSLEFDDISLVKFSELKCCPWKELDQNTKS